MGSFDSTCNTKVEFWAQYDHTPHYLCFNHRKFSSCTSRIFLAEGVPLGMFSNLRRVKGVCGGGGGEGREGGLTIKILVSEDNHNVEQDSVSWKHTETI
jgi:hypothetical protein